MVMQQQPPWPAQTPKLHLTHHLFLEGPTMKFNPTALTLVLALMSAVASAQTTASPQTLRTEQVLQRDVNQETRIRDGLQSGQLNTREAALLQREEAQVDRMQKNALKDGHISREEAARINTTQDRVSRDIWRANHNSINGNPLSASSQRMQAATQRDINQQQRIRDGVAQGQLTNKEVARLEAGQARDDQQQFRTGRDGHAGAAEAARVSHAQNARSTHIHNLRHNSAERKG
jgi:hypothetical protein